MPRQIAKNAFLFIFGSLYKIKTIVADDGLIFRYFRDVLFNSGFLCFLSVFLSRNFYVTLFPFIRIVLVSRISIGVAIPQKRENKPDEKHQWHNDRHDQV